MVTNEILMRCWNRMFNEGGNYKVKFPDEETRIINFFFRETKQFKEFWLSKEEYENWLKIKPKLREQ